MSIFIRWLNSKMKLGIELALIMIGLFAIIFYAAGMHGHITFRPHMREDWILWSIATFSTLSGFYFSIAGIKQIRKKD
jgi:hypothetical protein